MSTGGLAISCLVLILGAAGPVESELHTPPPPWKEVFAEAEVAFVGVVVAKEPQLVYRVLERFVGELEEEFTFPWPGRLYGRSVDYGQVDLVFAKRVSPEGDENWRRLRKPAGSYLPLAGWEESDAVVRTRAWAAEHPSRSSRGSPWASYSLPVFEFNGEDKLLHYTARCVGERTVEYSLYAPRKMLTMNAIPENIWPPGNGEYGVSERERDLLLRQMAILGLFDDLRGEGSVTAQLSPVVTTEDIPDCTVTLEISLRNYTDTNGDSRPIHQTLIFENPARPEDYSNNAERRRLTALEAITQIVKAKRPWWRREKLWLLGTVKE